MTMPPMDPMQDPMGMPPMLPPPPEALDASFVEMPIDGDPILPTPPADLQPPMPRPEEPYPEPVIKLSPARKDRLKRWLMDQVQALLSKHADQEKLYAAIETAYRAQPIVDDGFPFKGRATETIPVIAAAIDPIHARLNTGINKQDPVLRVRPITPKMMAYSDALEEWVNYRRRHILDLPRHTGPAYLELCKLGTTIFKTVFDHVETTTTGYEQPGWKVVRKTAVRYHGARVLPLSPADVFWGVGYLRQEDLPIIVERQRFTPDQLVVAADGDYPKLDPEAVKVLVDRATINQRTTVETARDAAAMDSPHIHEEVITLYEVWFEYDLQWDPSDPESKRSAPEKLVATIDLDTGELAQLRYNWYFHQQHPYTIIPYTLTNGSLRGLGIGEMSIPVQEGITRWYRMSSDNAYLANIRMWAAPKGAIREQRLQAFAGRVIPLNDPVKDLREIRMADTYPSTMTERGYLDQINQRRTGSNDYMGGNESPVVGSRATATSTLALIQEGSRRVEEVMENVRRGETDIALKCLALDIQYGPGDVFQRVFGEEETGRLLEQFFAETTVDELQQGIAIELAATDSGGSRAARQQTFMAIAQQVEAYTNRVVEMGQAAFQAAEAGQLETATLFADALIAHRRALREVFKANDIPDADQFLPDITDDLAAVAERAAAGAAAAQSAGVAGGGGQPPAGMGGPPGAPGAVAPPADGMGGDLAPDTGVPGVDRTLEQFARATGGP